MGNFQKKLKFYIITIFPQIFNCYLQFGIVSKAIKLKKLEVNVLNLRDFAPKGKVDDEAFGGISGMVLKVEPLYKALEFIKGKEKETFVITTEAYGRKIDQKLLLELTEKECICVFCGRYRGIDERFNEFVDLRVSLGDFILSGGEIPALALVEGTARLLEGVLSDERSKEEDSFFKGWVSYPVYTRPANFKGLEVPKVLLSGNHKLIELWKTFMRVKRTYQYRRELIPEKLSKLEELALKLVKEGKDFEDFLPLAQKLLPD